MLVIALFISCLLLILANVLVHRSPHPVPGVFLLAVASIVCPAGIMFSSYLTMLQGALLVVLLLPWWLLGRRRWVYTALSVSVTLLIYGYMAGREWHDVAEMLRAQPVCNLESRLPARPPAPGQPLSAPPVELKKLEDLVAEEEIRNRQMYQLKRADSLRLLHENTVEFFINLPGFGVMRMGYAGDPRTGLRTTPPLPQPGTRPTALLSANFELTKLAPVRATEEQRQWHLMSILDFVHPQGFGYIKDRRHVAGFQEHQFKEAPVSPQGWKLETVELVGLVVHPEPVVYISKYLPRMDELRRAPTRPLDAFESTGLKALRKGEQLHVADVGAVRRLLGAIRAVQQCVACHAGERGDLLGAFSYVLTRTTP